MSQYHPSEPNGDMPIEMDDFDLLSPLNQMNYLKENQDFKND